MKWYGYVHVNGKLFIRRYLGDYGDIEEATQSDFVQQCFGPFEADSKIQAVAKFKKILEQARDKAEYWFDRDPRHDGESI